MAAPANAQIPVEYPKADYEVSERGDRSEYRVFKWSVPIQCFLTASTNKEVATSLEHAIPPSLRGSFTATTVLTELAPMLMRIISPNLKPVRLHLWQSDAAPETLMLGAVRRSMLISSRLMSERS